mmetsp:Transcript_43062/g.102245  ORF Transcript_43062/g.102245 Transcript_43062/m.102245 type:complete len:202 (-) Transcript_43062:294-899(-)
MSFSIACYSQKSRERKGGGIVSADAIQLSFDSIFSTRNFMTGCPFLVLLRNLALVFLRARCFCAFSACRLSLSSSAFLRSSAVEAFSAAAFSERRSSCVFGRGLFCLPRLPPAPAPPPAAAVTPEAPAPSAGDGSSATPSTLGLTARVPLRSPSEGSAGFSSVVFRWTSALSTPSFRRSFLYLLTFFAFRAACLAKTTLLS